ncbi:hypothetical protein [Lysinibacillus xylanilyticus]|uniref:hypothetical protein n=1 Tax=Lysinibacillus xylanilyticus TaxID=582475 RepID=UPI003D035CD4
MTQHQNGQDALDALYAGNDGGSDNSFTTFKSGSTFKVRALGIRDLVPYYNYSIYKVVNSFVADKPSGLNKAGFPETNLTLWDKATEHYQKLANAEKDPTKKEALKKQASLYRGSTKFIMGFIDLDTGLPIVIDVTKPQGQAIHKVLMKANDQGKLDKKAFEIEKSGASTNTVCSASVLDLDDLNDKQRANYDKWDGKEFDKKLFDGLNFVADEAKQIEFLTKAGFDLTLIGIDATSTQDVPPSGTSSEDESEEQFDF